MKVSCVQSYDNYNKTTKLRRNFDSTQKIQNNTQVKSPNFKKSNFFKIVGFISGAAATIALAPGLAAIGLAGIGAGTVALIGATIDEDVDEANEIKEKNIRNS